MHRNTLILVGIMVGVLGITSLASSAGWGIPQPTKQPVSIREDSARGKPLGRGHAGTRFFLLGGGLHGGK